MLTSEQQKIYNVKVPKGGYGYYTLYHGIYDPDKGIDERPSYAQTGDLFEPEGSSVVYKATRKNGKTTWAIDEDAQRQSESGEGGEGGSLPADFPAEGIANANKFLGFDASGDYAALDAPAGGGAEKFVVTLTEDTSGKDPVWVANKTCAQIYAAHQAGKECVVQLTYEYDGVDFPVEAPLLIAIITGEGGQTSYACTFSIPFVLEASTIAMLNVVGVGTDKEEWDVNIAKVGAYVPDYDSDNNGKVLGVSSGSLAWVDNYAPLVVTLTEDQNDPGTYVGDKTFGEVKTAFEAGRNAVVTTPANNESVSVIQVAEDKADIVISTGNSEVTFTGAANEYPSITP